MKVRPSVKRMRQLQGCRAMVVMVICSANPAMQRQGK